jgi:NAD(P)-dependent dehydrogenase (short-subunit alcohol dehydrogenase family)
VIGNLHEERDPMKDFRDKLAVITGGGTGMGRELARQLSAEGCDVAMCDVLSENMAETKRLCEAQAPKGVRVSTHPCDVSKEEEMIAFRDALLATHRTDHINLLFNNAGIGGGASILKDDRAEWERTFNVCWYGVYYGTRTFLPLLVASDEGYIVNTSSVNGFWACLGPEGPHTAYSAAKFAVKGFTEALVVELRVEAPHVKAAVVMPGHIGTSIVINSGKVLGKGDARDLPAKDVARVREQLVRRGLPVADVDDDQIRAIMQQFAVIFRDNAPTTAAQAAKIILDGVRNDEWRILVGEDAKVVDRMVRESPDTAYEQSFMETLQASGHLRMGG